MIILVTRLFLVTQIRRLCLYSLGRGRASGHRFPGRAWKLLVTRLFLVTHIRRLCLHCCSRGRASGHRFPGRAREPVKPVIETDARIAIYHVWLIRDRINFDLLGAGLTNNLPVKLIISTRPAHILMMLPDMILPNTNSQFPIANSQLPITNSQKALRFYFRPDCTR